MEISLFASTTQRLNMGDTHILPLLIRAGILTSELFWQTGTYGFCAEYQNTFKKPTNLPVCKVLICFMCTCSESQRKLLTGMQVSVCCCEDVVLIKTNCCT
ncbi:hypothetical protein GOODEAATRI_010847 [Goodea atripinnis]|uniref:Uncharacterized protein n=1 Tax=Goodea atripinnis TaxID=208336 RepID=A0ABV0NC00_9TELE